MVPLVARSRELCRWQHKSFLPHFEWSRVVLYEGTCGDRTRAAYKPTQTNPGPHGCVLPLPVLYQLTPNMLGYGTGRFGYVFTFSQMLSHKAISSFESSGMLHVVNLSKRSSTPRSKALISTSLDNCDIHTGVLEMKKSITQTITEVIFSFFLI